MTLTGKIIKRKILSLFLAYLLSFESVCLPVYMFSSFFYK